MADLTPGRMARLRVWAQRFDANRPDWSDERDRHLYEGACPWCRVDDLQPGRNGYFDGNAHDLAIELLDEIDRLRAITKHLARCWAPWKWDATDDTMLACALCTGQVESRDLAVTRETGWHDENCPWRMAREATDRG